MCGGKAASASCLAWECTNETQVLELHLVNAAEHENSWCFGCLLNSVWNMPPTLKLFFFYNMLMGRLLMEKKEQLCGAGIVLMWGEHTSSSSLHWCKYSRNRAGENQALCGYGSES